MPVAQPIQLLVQPEPDPLGTLGSEEVALLHEAMDLTGAKSANDVMRIALKELVERQRFLSWVRAHEEA